MGHLHFNRVSKGSLKTIGDYPCARSSAPRRSPVARHSPACELSCLETFHGVPTHGWAGPRTPASWACQPAEPSVSEGEVEFCLHLPYYLPSSSPTSTPLSSKCQQQRYDVVPLVNSVLLNRGCHTRGGHPPPICCASSRPTQPRRTSRGFGWESERGNIG